MEYLDKLSFLSTTEWGPIIPVVVALILLGTTKFILKPPAQSLPPGPPSSWLFGTSISPNQAWRQFETWTGEYGPVFTVWLGWKPMIVIGTYDAAMQLLEKESAVTSDRPDNIVTNALSGGKRILVMRYGERWRRLRKALHQGLQPKMAASYEPVQERAARTLMLDLIQSPDDFQDHAAKYAASVIMTVAYGKTTPTRYTDPEVVSVTKCLGRLGHAARPGVYLVESFPFLRHFPSKWKSDAKKWHQEELGLFLGRYLGVKEDMKKGEGIECFARWLSEHQEEYELSDSEAAYVCGSLFGAGSDTTSSAISIAIMAATLYPSAAKRAQEELDRVIGRERPPNYSDFEDLPYLQAFVKEVHRWRPVASGGFAHATTEAVVYNGYVIPKGTALVGNHWSISRDPAVFPEPEEFLPERWFEDGNVKSGKIRKDINHVAFGFGRRVCSGRNVAERSVAINCALLLWSFEFSKKIGTDGKPIEIDSLAFTNSANSHPLPYQVSITARSGVSQILEELVNV